MMAVADSGSTKADWRLLLPDGTEVATSTAGFNPYFSNTETIIGALRQDDVLMAQAERMTEVHFYGAGCSTVAMCEIVAQALRAVFPMAQIVVEHDLLGAARACCGDRPAIAGILGTGSNCCWFDGTAVRDGLPSLGFILGDEAGGVWFGKRLVTDWLYGQMPSSVASAMAATGWHREPVLDRIYRQPMPNTFLASFMPILTDLRAEPYVQALLAEGFGLFVCRHVRHFPEHISAPVNFVGSVAHHFTDELRAACEAQGIRFGRVVGKPIDGLVDFHRQRKPFP